MINPNQKIIKPLALKEEHLVYLDALRDSCVTPMFGAGKFLVKDFPLDEKEATQILSYWMRTFSLRNKGE